MTTAAKPKKKKMLKRIVIIIVAVLLILALITGVLFMNGGFGGAAQAQTQPDVQSAAAQTSSIITTVVGTGNLANSEALSITIPSGLTADEVLVEAGDTVKQGDTLATFTEASVQSRITEVQTQIEALNVEIETAAEDSEGAYITANVSGRVKAIYVEEGDSVESVVVENGSLMIVSLDGLMAVSFEMPASLSAGDSVTVKLSDGTKKTGTVESISGGVCVVTLTDNGPKLEDAVTIYNTAGEEIGTGSLYIHKPLGITGTYGTVKSLHVGENNTISADTKLVTLKDGESLTYQTLVSQREEAVELLQELLSLSQTNSITAAFDGTVESVSLTSDNTGTANSASAASGTGSAAGYGMSAGDSQALPVTRLSTVESEGEDSSSEPEPSSVQETVEILSLTDLSLTTPAADAVPQTDITGIAYTGKVQWSPADTAFKAGTDYTAQVTLTAADGYAFGTSLTADTSWYPADGTVSDVKLTDGVFSFSITYSVAAAADTDTNTTDPGSASDASGGNSSSGGNGTSAYSGSISGATGSYSASGTTGSTGSAGGTTGTADTTGTQSSTTDAAANTKTTAFTISENNSMDLSISVDELDILNVEVGQTAAVTLDAVEDETYTATVIKVNTSGTSSGGVTKYSVDLSIERSEKMLSGMTASATITIQEAADILVIPVDALQESRGSVYVYTGLDVDGATLMDEVEVETGLSDGNYVEIVSGLSEGDEVYYTVSVSSDSTVMEQGNFTFGAGGGFADSGGDTPDFGSGERPSMDNMPSRD